MTAPHLVFPGLVLRPFADTDADAFAAAVVESVASVSPWMGWCTSDYTAADALEWFAMCRAGQAAGTAFEFGIFDQQSGDFLGGAGLNDIRMLHRFCNLGYWVRQSRQGQGVASRCVQALAAHAFGALDLHRVEIVVAVGNAASLAVAAKSGALDERIARNRLCIDGRAVDAHVFSLISAHGAAPEYRVLPH
ncbi:GNAT family N-acetyltransferase [Duganella phyllosphaerae]|uniref:Putative ribosomal N-acetyltransferase YdaF n=1 Tax=Duganella phyllosphaerae TaxID=762836 RepID=A0A1E7X5Y2_9BURK|nr:GNAT family protein [Duganella phyllosphaerae]OFA08367.1 putative ribosomal N-acetyltransferase YdaF [Duganella phyllosphaerae]